MATDLIYPQIEVTNDSGNPIPVVFPGSSYDAFGRQRVSEVFTLGDYKHIYAIDPNFLNNTGNGGNIVFNANKAAATLSTTSNTSSYAIHQTKFYHSYQPGKSQIIFSSINFGYAQRNVTKRTGYFDDRDGIFFEQVGSDISNGTNNGTLNFVIRSYTGGSASEADVGSYKRRVPQSSWNVDKCDGTGPSGFNLDISKTQLVYIDFQWLGVGRVRCGFVHNGKVIIAHEYYHSGVLSEVYISNPNLPVRCEIRNTGTTTGGNFDQICSTVMSEGGYAENGIDFDYLMSSSRQIVGGASLPLICIKLANTFKGYPNRISVKLGNVSIYSTGETIAYELVKLPSDSSLSGTLNWTSVNSESGVLYSVSATGFTVADASPLFAGFISSGSSQNSLSQVSTGAISAAKKNIIVQNFDSSSSEVYALIANNIGNNTAQVRAALQWREIY